jgi:hypothetical protein
LRHVFKSFTRTHTQESVSEGALHSDVTSATLGPFDKNQEPEALEPSKKVRILSSEREKGFSRKVEEVLIKEEQLSRTRSCSPSLKDGSLKSKTPGSRKDRNDSDILTTDLLYFVPKVHDENAEPGECSAEDPNVLGT